MTDLNLSMFRAYDIRTPAASLSDSLAERLCRAEAVYFRDTLQAEGVVVAHDARTSGPRYLEIGAHAYARAGLPVVVVPGACSASMFYFTCMRHPRHAGVMFGASHNPAGDTGQKVLGPGVRPVAEHIGPAGGLDRIRALYEAGQGVDRRAPAAPARIAACDPLEQYVGFSMQLAGVTDASLQGIPVFHDYLSGAASREMMVAFGAAGADLTPLHFAADGSFPCGDPNPVKQDVIREGLGALRAGGYLLGTLFDGDGDRIDFYRGDGAYLSSSFVYAAVLPRVRERFPDADAGVFADLKANPLAVMEMARRGVRVEVIRNGHSQIKNAMFEDPRMFGTVEESAHFYEAFLDRGERYCTENTLYIALLVSREWAEGPARFEALFDVQARTAREREWGYKFPGEDERAGALRAVREHFENEGARAITRMPNGYDLEATLMRRGIPFEIDAATRLAADWLQVCQRASQSETGLARWEVVASRPDIAAEAKARIARIVRRYGAGEEYQG